MISNFANTACQPTFNAFGGPNWGPTGFQGGFPTPTSNWNANGPWTGHSGWTPGFNTGFAFGSPSPWNVGGFNQPFASGGWNTGWNAGPWNGWTPGFNTGFNTGFNHTIGFGGGGSWNAQPSNTTGFNGFNGFGGWTPGQPSGNWGFPGFGGFPQGQGWNMPMNSIQNFSNGFFNPGFQTGFQGGFTNPGSGFNPGFTATGGSAFPGQNNPGFFGFAPGFQKFNAEYGTQNPGFNQNFNHSLNQNPGQPQPQNGGQGNFGFVGNGGPKFTTDAA